MSYDTDSNEYLETERVASIVRGYNSEALGELLTLVEVAHGDSIQGEALKKRIKAIMYNLSDDIQGAVREVFYIERKEKNMLTYTIQIPTEKSE